VNRHIQHEKYISLLANSRVLFSHSVVSANLARPYVTTYFFCLITFYYLATSLWKQFFPSEDGCVDFLLNVDKFQYTTRRHIRGNRKFYSQRRDSLISQLVFNRLHWEHWYRAFEEYREFGSFRRPNEDSLQGSTIIITMGIFICPYFETFLRL
jgi:hypothetical protein